MDTTVYTSSSAAKKRSKSSAGHRPDNAKKMSSVGKTRDISKAKSVSKAKNISRAKELSKTKEISKAVIAKWVIAAVLVIAFTVSTEVINHPGLYLYSILAVGLIILFHKEFSIKAYGKTYITSWKPWVWTAVCALIAFGAVQLKTYILWTLFSGKNIGLISLYLKENYFEEAVFAITMIVLLPIAENLFLRKAMLSSNNKALVAALTVVSLVGSAIFFAHGIPGIIYYVILAAPFTVVYLITRNVYITITAQIIIAAYIYIPDIAYDIARMMLR